VTHRRSVVRTLRLAGPSELRRRVLLTTPDSKGCVQGRSDNRRSAAGFEEVGDSRPTGKVPPQSAAVLEGRRTDSRSGRGARGGYRPTLLEGRRRYDRLDCRSDARASGQPVPQPPFERTSSPPAGRPRKRQSPCRSRDTSRPLRVAGGKRRGNPPRVIGDGLLLWRPTTRRSPPAPTGTLAAPAVVRTSRSAGAPTSAKNSRVPGERRQVPVSPRRR
jgi:hypothetical protein